MNRKVMIAADITIVKQHLQDLEEVLQILNIKIKY